MATPTPSAPYDLAVSTLSVRALLFTDIEGSTLLVRRLGERYEEVLARHQTIIRDVAAKRSGREQSRQGDSLFFTFPSATAAIEAAVDAQRRMEHEPWPVDGLVRVRMGLHVGEVTESRAGLVGLAIHQAARIMSVAHGGQVVLSGDVVQHAHVLSPDIEVHSLGSYELRDVGRILLYQVSHPELQQQFPDLGINRAKTHNLPVPLTSTVDAQVPPMDAALPLFGRRSELSTIDRLVADGRNGRSGVLVIEGEPGIGKTALLDHAAYIAGDATVLRAAGIQSELDLHYAGLGRLLQPVSRFASELEPSSAALLLEILGKKPAEPVLIRDRFGAGLATLSMFALVADEHPLVVIVDDVHWMDGPTVEALAFVARRLLAEGVVVLLSRRLETDVARLEALPRLHVTGLHPSDAWKLLERTGVNLSDGRLSSLVAAHGG